MEVKVKFLIWIIIVIIMVAVVGCSYFSKLLFKEKVVLKDSGSEEGIKIIFLHHSTGKVIWDGGVKQWFSNYNNTNKTNYVIVEQDFPKKESYGWNNYPFDYWNIWVNHAGEQSFKGEPTLEIIIKKYDVVILKHCFPVSNIEEDYGNPDVSSSVKSLENYKLQYLALKDKMKEFNQTKFIVWTIPALVERQTSYEKALRAQEFYNWVKNDWDETGDNIFLWDFYELETEGGLYLKDEYAESSSNSHPNESFSKKVVPFFCQRIIDIIEDKGDISNITGK